MQRSRRQLLCALGAGLAAGTAGCSGLDRVTPNLGSPSTPDGRLSETLSDALFAPDRFEDANHRRFLARDVAALREGPDSPVASAMLEFPTTKAEQGFGLVPDSIDGFARYRPTELLVGSFSKSEIVASYREDGWTVTDSYHGIEEVRHPERPEYYASGVGEGVIITTARAREIPVGELLRAHAAALAGETDRYREDPGMAELLSVIGGAEQVSAITRPVDLSDRLQYTRAVGQGLEPTTDGVAETVAFVFDESAPESPIQYVDEWADRISGGQSGSGGGATGLQEQLEGFLGSLGGPSIATGAEGRVGYFRIERSVDSFEEDAGVLAQLRDSDPSIAVQDRVDEQFAAANPPAPPEANFSIRAVPDAEPVCGTGEYVVELTYESGPEIVARRLFVGFPQVGRFQALGDCEYEYDDRIAPGETVRIAFEIEPNRLVVFWSDPHGGPPERLGILSV
jgi:hypothetical protein